MTKMLCRQILAAMGFAALFCGLMAALTAKAQAAEAKAAVEQRCPLFVAMKGAERYATEVSDGVIVGCKPQLVAVKDADGQDEQAVGFRMTIMRDGGPAYIDVANDGRVGKAETIDQPPVAQKKAPAKKKAVKQAAAPQPGGETEPKLTARPW